MRKLSSNPNVILSDSNYPNGRIRNNTGTGNGTPVNESVYGDIHVNKDKMMDLYGIIPNNLPDNEAYGYQIIEAYRALASKNDFVLPLSLNTGVLSVPIKIGFMLENEQLICKAGFNMSTETQIKGSDNVTLNFTSNGSFKTGEYVRLIKNASSITIVRIADDISLDAMLQVLVYLKKASQLEENAGTIDTKGTTPLSNKTAFIRRVNGLDSSTYLATTAQNGLLSKEDKLLINSLGSLRNVGTFSGFDPGAGTVGDLYTVSGNITQAQVQNVISGVTTVQCTMSNEMDNTNYMVEIYIESLSNFNQDTTIYPALFKPISTTQFQVSMREPGSFTQNLKLHLKVVQL
jgi:hypothetical protein